MLAIGYGPSQDPGTGEMAKFVQTVFPGLPVERASVRFLRGDEGFEDPPIEFERNDVQRAAAGRAAVEVVVGTKGTAPRRTAVENRVGHVDERGALVVTDRIRDMIRDNPNLNAIRQESVKSGMKYLQEDGLRQVIEGKTSIQELLRVSK